MKKKTALVFMVLLSINLALALDCPKGIENDPYPGICGMYEDQDKNMVCDFSQEDADQIEGILETQKANRSREYYFYPISIISLILYALSFFLVRKGKISAVLHKRIWNILLLISFLGVGVTGILLVLKASYGIVIDLGFNMLFWHVETGIVMTAISFFHILWHWQYFKSYFRIKTRD